MQTDPTNQAHKFAQTLASHIKNHEMDAFYQTLTQRKEWIDKLSQNEKKKILPYIMEEDKKIKALIATEMKQLQEFVLTQVHQKQAYEKYDRY